MCECRLVFGSALAVEEIASWCVVFEREPNIFVQVALQSLESSLVEQQHIARWQCYTCWPKFWLLLH